MRRFRVLTLLGVAALLLVAGLGASAAQEEASEAEGELERRIIRIEGSGITTSGNPRYGPIAYRHPSDPEGVVATVSNLTIYAQNAELRVPANRTAPDDERVTLGAARGERVAEFDGGVRAERGRLDALGPQLVYAEASGLGTLTGGADVTIAPEDPADDPTTITADGIEFNVDTDRSRSFGDVVLVDGNQRAEAGELDFAEAQDLGCLTAGGEGTGGDAERPRIVRRADDGDELVITADRICVLTAEETLHATGDVTVVDGDITSRGSEVFYDDTVQIAEIFGDPAVSEQNGSRLEADRIRQNIEFDFVEQLPDSAPTPLDRTRFEFAEQAADPASDAP